MSKTLFNRVSTGTLTHQEVKLGLVKGLIYCCPIAYHNHKMIGGPPGLFYHYQKGREVFNRESSSTPQKEFPYRLSTPYLSQFNNTPLSSLSRYARDLRRSTKARLRRLQEEEKTLKPKSIIKEYITLQELYSQGKLKPQYRKRLDQLHELFQGISWAQSLISHYKEAEI